MAKAIVKGTRDKVMIDTGKPGSPFITAKLQTRRIYIFGILVWENKNTNVFPEPLR